MSDSNQTDAIVDALTEKSGKPLSRNKQALMKILIDRGRKRRMQEAHAND